jgi:flagellar biosynthesis/type III secretory pathway protein FliH
MPGDFIIKPWLEANRKGVRNMLLTEYNEEETMELFKEEYLNKGREEGLKEGHKEGLEAGHKAGLKEGHEEGLKEGCDKLSLLIKELITCGKSADIERVVTDSGYRDKLMEDMGLINDNHQSGKQPGVV